VKLDEKIPRALPVELHKSSFTKGRIPVKLVYWEKLNNRFEAAKKEKVIKGYSRLKKSKLVNSLH